MRNHVGFFPRAISMMARMASTADPIMHMPFTSTSSPRRSGPSLMICTMLMMNMCTMMMREMTQNQWLFW